MNAIDQTLMSAVERECGLLQFSEDHEAKNERLDDMMMREVKEARQRILIYYAAHGAMVKQQWSANERGHFIRVARWDDGKWRLDMSGHFRLDATHWMPIPPAPQEKGR